MKNSSWIIVFFMIFGVFASIDRSKVVANEQHPLISTVMTPTPTKIGLNLNTNNITVEGTNDVIFNVEQPEKLISSVETRIEYVTKEVYREDVLKSTKLINKLLPLQRPAFPSMNKEGV